MSPWHGSCAHHFELFEGGAFEIISDSRRMPRHYLRAKWAKLIGKTLPTAIDIGRSAKYTIRSKMKPVTFDILIACVCSPVPRFRCNPGFAISTDYNSPR
jgi:hypothetical protein